MDPLTLAGIGAGTGALGSLLGAKKSSKPKLLQTPLQTQNLNFLNQLVQSPTPDYPTQQVAELTDAQKKAGEMTTAYANSNPQGMEYLQSLVDQNPDILSDPAYKALFDKVMEAGNQEVNRVGRSLQLRGGINSSTGRNVLGRSIEDVQGNALAALAPFVAQRVAQQASAAQTLASLGENATLSRINALSQQGALEMQLDQLRKDADYQRKMMTLNYATSVKAPIAQSLAFNQPTYYMPDQTTEGELFGNVLMGAGKGIMGGAFSTSPSGGSITGG